MQTTLPAFFNDDAIVASPRLTVVIIIIMYLANSGNQASRHREVQKVDDVKVSPQNNRWLSKAARRGCSRPSRRITELPLSEQSGFLSSRGPRVIEIVVLGQSRAAPEIEQIREPGKGNSHIISRSSSGVHRVACSFEKAACGGFLPTAVLQWGDVLFRRCKAPKRDPIEPRTDDSVVAWKRGRTEAGAYA